MSQSIPPSSPTAAKTPSRWILLVDDESSIRQLAKLVLSNRGHDLRLADSAQAALALVDAAEGPPALLICDVIMPKTDGLVLARQLRARLPGLKVIFISGQLADSAWWPADMTEIPLLAKPLSNAAFLEAVETALADPPTLK